MLTLPEDLVILAVGAKPRGGPNNGKLSWRFPYGIRGAMLVALTLAGRVEVTDGQIVVRDSAPLGDPSLDADLAGLAVTRGGTPVGEWMRDTPPRFVSAYFDRLEAAGLLRSETVMLLFIAKRVGYRLVDPAYYENLRGKIRAVGAGAGVHHAVHAAIHASVHASVQAAVSGASTASHHHSSGTSGGDSSPSHHHG
jgi:Golgi phosphoprotein 3 (GPP34)